MRKSNRYKSLLLLPVLLLPLILAACSEKITETPGPGTELRINASPGGLSDLGRYSGFLLTVTGPGIYPPIQEPLLLENQRLTGSVTVPAGPERLFRIETFDETGRIIYAGQTVADVEAGATLTLTIDLYPQVPMIKVVPPRQEVNVGGIFSLTIKIYNMPNLSSIGFVFYKEANQYCVGPQQNIALNPDIANFTQLVWTYYNEPGAGDNSLYIEVSHLNSGDCFVDESGYAELLTIDYRVDWGCSYPTDTLDFYPRVTYTKGTDGNPLPLEKIYEEKAVVEVYYYRAYRIAD